jgi:hypothetical protein
MQVGGDRSTARQASITLLVGGTLLAMAGAAGDFIWHGLHPDEHAALLEWGSGEVVWHLTLFGGLAVAGLGAVMWAARRGTERGSLAAAGLAIVLATTLGAAAWSVSVSGNRSDEALAAGGDDHGAAAVAQPDAQAETAAGGHGGVVVPNTPEQQAEVNGILEQVKSATARYRKVKMAEADGYFQVTQFIPGLGLHYYNPAYRGAFDPLKPQILLYEPATGGKLKLAGVAYSLPKQGTVAPDGFPGTEDVWHFHDNLCFMPGGTVTLGTAADCRAGGGVFVQSTGWLLHAWLFEQNPDGVFTEANPNVG